MKTIKHIEIKGILGIIEKEINPGKVTVISGATGSGKTSILDAIGLVYRNDSRRGTVVNTDCEKGMIMIQHDDDSTVKRMINKAGATTTLNFEKDGSKKTSPNAALKELFGESAFIPSSFMDKSKAEQKNILLSMIPMNISQEDFDKDFKGRTVDLSLHALEVCKILEKEIYKERTGINGELKSIIASEERLKTQLPKDFDNEKWVNEKISDRSKELIEATEINNNIQKGKDFLETYEEIVESTVRSQKTSSTEDYEAENEEVLNVIKKLEKELKEAKKSLEINKKIYENDLIVDEKTCREKMEDRKGKVDKYLATHEVKDLEAIQEIIENTETMKALIPIYSEHQKVLTQWTEKGGEKAKLEKQLDRARTKPNELMEGLEMPIEGLGIDAKGNVTIDGLEISNQSQGEQWKLVCEIAMAEISKNPDALKVICLDGFEALNPKEQEKFLTYAETTDFQFFVTCVKDGDLKIETRG